MNEINGAVFVNFWVMQFSQVLSLKKTLEIFVGNSKGKKSWFSFFQKAFLKFYDNKHLLKFVFDYLFRDIFIEQ